MDNYQIADAFSLLSKLMDIHGENSFKSKSYASTAFAIEKLTVQLSEIPLSEISFLKGIGGSSAQKIIEFLQTGKIFSLEELIAKTPVGVIEMLNIKGIGPKKINTIWKEMEIESVGELYYACKENRLKLYKGFGEKTQQNVIESIDFYFKSKGSHLYASVSLIAEEMEKLLQRVFPENKIKLTGEFARQLEIINKLDFIVDAEINEIKNKIIKGADGFELKDETSEFLMFNTVLGIDICIHTANQYNFIEKSIQLSSSSDFLERLSMVNQKMLQDVKSEEEYFINRGLSFIPSFLREKSIAVEKAMNSELPEIIQIEDIKGIIHCHSDWSDGSNSIEELAKAAIDKGFEYLVMSDHSKSAFYAQGLSEEKIYAQHKYIDELNEKLKPFKIFKSIESDILNDGSLDYSDKILSTFDLIIASVHSNLKMSEGKAMARLIKAIENPFTTILGHMTGRLLLSRPGYPVDHKKIIDACSANNVTIELNAHPSRLDIDWRQIDYALEKNVLISINPDAHVIEGMNDVKYGVLVAQKALVTKQNNLSSFSLIEFENYIESLRKK